MATVKVIGRTREPVLTAEDADRSGYVPNVVYTCGAIRVGDDIFLPYGVADSSVCFAFVAIKDILDAIDALSDQSRPRAGGNVEWNRIVQPHQFQQSGL